MPDDTPTVTIPQTELQRLLADLAHLRQQRNDLQAYAGRLLEERTRPAEAALVELQAAVRELFGSWDDQEKWSAIFDRLEALVSKEAP